MRPIEERSSYWNETKELNMGTSELSPTDDKATLRDAGTIAAFLWPWKPALLGGAIGAGGSLLLGLLPPVGISLFGPLSAGLFLFFLVGGVGSVWRTRSSSPASEAGRAGRWIARHPWRYALVPALALLATLFVAGVVLPGSALGALFSGFGEAAVVFAATGIVAAVQRRS
jgi:hypothetical protein